MNDDSPSGATPIDLAGDAPSMHLLKDTFAGRTDAEDARLRASALDLIEVLVRAGYAVCDTLVGDLPERWIIWAPTSIDAMSAAMFGDTGWGSRPSVKRQAWAPHWMVELLSATRRTAILPALERRFLLDLAVTNDDDRNAMLVMVRGTARASALLHSYAKAKGWQHPPEVLE